MKKKKIKKYAGPKYPNKDLYASHPELLFSSVPARWLKSKAATGALVTFILGGLTDCNSDSKLLEVKTVQKLEKPGKTIEEAKVEKVKIAPLFIHGDGTGATGCIIMSPPVFLSEAEAWDIILTELQKENLVFEKRKYRVENVFTEEWIRRYAPEMEVSGEIWANLFDVKNRSPLYLEAFNKDLNLGLKFIGRDNYFDLRGDILGLSTVIHYNLIELAQELREAMKEKGKVNAAFFFDPMVRRNHIGSYADIENKDKQELREQVKEFIKWLRSEFPENTTKKKSAP